MKFLLVAQGLGFIFTQLLYLVVDFFILFGIGHLHCPCCPCADTIIGTGIVFVMVNNFDQEHQFIFDNSIESVFATVQYFLQISW